MTVRVNKQSFNIREKLSELERPIGLKGSELMKSDTLQDVRDLVSAGRKNKIINGDMRVSQRGTSFTINSSSGVDHTLDRFRIYHGNVASTGTVTQNSSNGLDGYANSLKFECTGGASSVDAGDDCWIRYIVEKMDLPNYGWPSNQSMTLSFWARSNKAGKHSVSVVSGNFQSQHYNHAYELDNNVWKHVKITIPPPNSWTINGDSGLRIYWPLAVGSNYQTSTVDQWIYSSNNFAVSGAQQIQGITGATFEITGVQLEVGKNATEFEHRSYGEELALCQRYYQNSFHQSAGKYPGNTDNDNGIIQTCWSDGNSPFGMFPTPMRAQPTVTLRQRGTNNAGKVEVGGSQKTGAAYQVTNQGVGYIGISSGVAGAWCAFSYELDAEI